MKEILQKLCHQVPEALGIAVCDLDGESLALAIGYADFPDRALDLVKCGLPRQFDSHSWSEENSKRFILRQWAAEPSRCFMPLHRVHEGAGLAPPTGFSLRFNTVDLLVHELEEEMYVVLIVRRPCIVSIAKKKLESLIGSVQERLHADQG